MSAIRHLHNNVIQPVKRSVNQMLDSETSTGIVSKRSWIKEMTKITLMGLLNQSDSGSETSSSSPGSSITSDDVELNATSFQTMFDLAVAQKVKQQAKKIAHKLGQDFKLHIRQGKLSGGPTQ